MLRAATKNGVDLSQHRAKQVTVADMRDYDIVVAMDSENLEDMQSMLPQDLRSKPVLFLPTYAPDLRMTDTPDPYYSGGHENVLKLIGKAVRNMLSTEGLARAEDLT